MLSPAEPVKPVSQPRRESLSAMYSLWRGGWGREKWPGGGHPAPWDMGGGCPLTMWASVEGTM